MERYPILEVHLEKVIRSILGEVIFVTNQTMSVTSSLFINNILPLKETSLSIKRTDLLSFMARFNKKVAISVSV